MNSVNHKKPAFKKFHTKSKMRVFLNKHPWDYKLLIPGIKKNEFHECSNNSSDAFENISKSNFTRSSSVGCLTSTPNISRSRSESTLEFVDDEYPLASRWNSETLDEFLKETAKQNFTEILKDSNQASSCIRDESLQGTFHEIRNFNFGDSASFKGVGKLAEQTVHLSCNHNGQDESFDQSCQLAAHFDDAKCEEYLNQLNIHQSEIRELLLKQENRPILLNVLETIGSIDTTSSSEGPSLHGENNANLCLPFLNFLNGHPDSFRRSTLLPEHIRKDLKEDYFQDFSPIKSADSVTNTSLPNRYDIENGERMETFNGSLYEASVHSIASTSQITVNVSRLENEIQKLEQTKCVMSKEREELSSQLHTTEDELRDLQIKYRQIQFSFKELKEKNCSLEQDLTKACQDVESEKEITKLLQEKNFALRKEREHLQLKYNNMDKECHDMHEKLMDMGIDKEKLENSIKNYNVQILDLRSELQKSQEALTMKDNKILHLDNLVCQIKTDVVNFSEICFIFKQELSKIKESFSSALLDTQNFTETHSSILQESSSEDLEALKSCLFQSSLISNSIPSGQELNINEEIKEQLSPDSNPGELPFCEKGDEEISDSSEEIFSTFENFQTWCEKLNGLLHESSRNQDICEDFLELSKNCYEKLYTLTTQWKEKLVQESQLIPEITCSSCTNLDLPDPQESQVIPKLSDPSLLSPQRIGCGGANLSSTSISPLPIDKGDEIHQAFLANRSSFFDDSVDCSEGDVILPSRRVSVIPLQLEQKCDDHAVSNSVFQSSPAKFEISSKDIDITQPDLTRTPGISEDPGDVQPQHVPSNPPAAPASSEPCGISLRRLMFSALLTAIAYLFLCQTYWSDPGAPPYRFKHCLASFLDLFFTRRHSGSPPI